MGVVIWRNLRVIRFIIHGERTVLPRPNDLGPHAGAEGSGAVISSRWFASIPENLRLIKNLWPVQDIECLSMGAALIMVTTLIAGYALCEWPPGEEVTPALMQIK